MWARIEDGVVREITDTDPAGRYHDSLLWVACPTATKEGWTYAGDPPGFAAPSRRSTQASAQASTAPLPGPLPEVAPPVITGDRFANPALASLLQALHDAGVIVDQTT